MSFALFYRNRLYFIATIGSLEEGQAFLRQIWIQIISDINTDAHMVELDITRPLVEDIYYDTYIFVEWDNRRSCDDIKSEKKLGTHCWDWCVIMSVFGVSVVNYYNVSKQLLAYKETSHELFCALDKYTVVKNMDSSPTRLPSKRT